MMRVANDYGVFNARRARVLGINGKVTHRDQKSGELWFETDLPGASSKDGWYPNDMVEIL